MGSTNYESRATSLFFRRGLQVRETSLEVIADHAVHAEENTYELRDVRTRTTHGPGHVGGVAFRLEHEFGDVVAFERFDEVELDGDLRGCRCIDDLHAPLADFAVALPIVHGGLAVRGAAKSPLHVRIHLLPGRPDA